MKLGEESEAFLPTSSSLNLGIFINWLVGSKFKNNNNNNNNDEDYDNDTYALDMIRERKGDTEQR